MSLNNPRPHHGHASEYQASGFPFVASLSHVIGDGAAKTVTVSFPYVTRWIIVNVHGGNGIIDGHVDKVNFGFGNFDGNEGVSGANAVNITTIRNIRMEVKCGKCFFKLPASNDTYVIDVIAGLTNVQEGDFPSVHNERYLSGVTSTTKRGTALVDFAVFSVA